MAGVGIDTRIYPTEKMERVTFSSEQGGGAHSSMAYKRQEQERFYNVQSSLTLEEVRYSEMRKKIPGMGRVPKDRIQVEQDLEFLRRKQEHITFVKQNFRQIECQKFVPRKKQESSVKRIRDLKCECGEILTEHAGLSNIYPMKNIERDIAEKFLVPEALRGIINRETAMKTPPKTFPDVPWDKKEAFRDNISTTFGKINFVNVENQGGSKPAKYIRLSHTDSVTKLIDLMENHWKIMEPRPPSLCISVIGGAKSFKLDNKMRGTFNTGLIKAAKTTNAWLITSGFNVGVMKAVGQAVSEGQSFLWDNDRITHTLRLIGIGPWGYVKDRKYLESDHHDGNGRFPVNFKTSNVILHGQPVPLNPNHTHFVFVDDGVRNYYAGASEFRAQFEQTVSKPSQEGGLGIPVVLLILEGGTDAINDAKVSLQHKIPVVVCSGTGRAADILAYAYSHTKSNKGEMKERHIEKLRDKIIDAYGKSWKEEDVEPNFQKHFGNVKACMEHRDLISIFHMNKHEDLDIAILTALLKAKAGEASDEVRLNQLKLALTWNRADIAQEEIFREDVLWPTGSLDEFLIEAILEDRVEFVQLILQQNVVMKEFLTMNKLKKLYEMSLKRPDSVHLQKLLKKKVGYLTEFSFIDLDKVMDNLMDKYDDDFEEDVEDLLDKDGKMKSGPMKQLTYKWPYKQLLVWSILMLRQKMAKFSWEMGSEPVTSAIAASRIYGSMAETIHRNEYALKERIMSYKNEFEQLAKHVLDDCHYKHQEKAMMLAERKSPTWSSMTSMQMAASAEDRAFQASVACQNSIDNTWKRGIKSSPLKVLWTVICPILILTPFLEVSPMGEKKASIYQKFLTFYTAPITKFAHHSILYLVFLGLFTYLVLVDYQFYEISFVEIFCIVWILTFIIDDFYTLLTFPSPTFKGKLRDWYGILKFMDLMNLALAICAFLVRIFTMEKYAKEAKVIYSFNCIIFFIRVLKLYTTNSSLGPKLVMIKKMFEEMRMFLLVLVVFLLAYGVASQSLLYMQRDRSWLILKDVVFFPYWQLYGELDFESAMSTDSECIQNVASMNNLSVMSRTVETLKCRHEYWMVYFLCAGYLIFGNILLFNLLIAIFNHIFTTVEQNSIEIWKFQMYFMTMEFDNKTALVPPLSIIPHFYLFLKWIARKTCCKKDTKGVQFTKRHLEFLQLFEKEEMANYLRNLKDKQKDSAESKLHKRVEELFKLVEEELNADHASHSANLGTTQPVVMVKKDDNMETCLLDTSGWPKPEAVIEYGRQNSIEKALSKEKEKRIKQKLEPIVALWSKEIIHVISEEEAEKEAHKEKKKKKKHKKEKKKKKEKEDEKIINTDQTSSAKPESESRKEIPTDAWQYGRSPQQLSPRSDSHINMGSTALKRRLTPQFKLHTYSDDSDLSDDNFNVNNSDKFNILSSPKRSPASVERNMSDSDSDRRSRHRRKKTSLRVESSTEDERRIKKKTSFLRRRRSNVSDSD